jgi:hypothetical protein
MSVDRILLGAVIATIIVTALGGIVEAVSSAWTERSAAEYVVGPGQPHVEAVVTGSRRSPG